MVKSIKDKPKRGRPASGRDPMSGVRMPIEERRAIEAWGARQSPKLTFSKALRYLAQRGLAVADIEAQVESNRAGGAKRSKKVKAD